MNKFKIIKYIIIFLFVILFVLLPGELYQNYLDQFNDFYELTFELPADCDSQELLNDLEQASAENNVHIFKIVTAKATAFSTEYDIYSDDYVYNLLTEDYKIEFGEIVSIFSGKTTINHYTFHEIPDELVKKDNKYYVAGDDASIQLLKSQVEDSYDDSSLIVEGANEINSARIILIAAAFILVILNVFLSFYDIQYQKKEIFLRLTMGQSTMRYYLFNVIADSVFVLISAAVTGAVVFNYEKRLPFFIYVVAGIATIIISNVLIYLLLFKISHKEVLSESNLSAEKKTLKLQYVIHGICFLLVTVLLATNIAVISECLDYYKQKEFFQEHKDYYWYQGLRFTDGENEDDIEPENEFINRFSNSMEIFYLCECSEISEKNSKLFYEANLYTADYLKSEIKELQESPLDKEVYILTHKNEKLSDYDKERLISWADTDSYEILEYSEHVEIIHRELDSAPYTSTVKDPVIVFYNHEQIAEEGCMIYELFLCMVKTDHDALAEFLDEYNLTCIETNALDFFEYNWTRLSRTLLINIVLFIMMLFMEILVSYSIISLEFKVNATEIALKKVNGYNLFERFSVILLSTFILWIICLIVTVIVTAFVRPGVIVYELLGAVIMLILNYVIIAGQIQYYDKMKISKILKGGAL